MSWATYQPPLECGYLSSSWNVLIAEPLLSAGSSRSYYNKNDDNSCINWFQSCASSTSEELPDCSQVTTALEGTYGFVAWIQKTCLKCGQSSEKACYFLVKCGGLAVVRFSTFETDTLKMDQLAFLDLPHLLSLSRCPVGSGRIKYNGQNEVVTKSYSVPVQAKQIIPIRYRNVFGVKSQIQEVCL